MCYFYRTMLSNPKAIVLGAAVGVGIFALGIWAFIGNPLSIQKRWNLPPVRVVQSSRVYFLPDCPKYSTLKPSRYFELPTAQEADLSGYRVAKGNCKDYIDARVQLERELFGQMKPTSEMLERFRQNQAQVAIESKIEDVQFDLEQQQIEMQQKLDEIEADRY